MAEDWGNKSFADRIDAAREAKGISQGELERRVGMHDPKTGKGKGYISRIRKDERGTSMKREWLVKLAQELDVELAWLMAGVGPMRRAEGAPPAGGLALARFVAARLNYHPDAIEAVSARFVETPNVDANDVLKVMEAESKILRDRDAARAGHADEAKKRRVQIETEERKADRKRKAAAKAAPKETSPPPASKRSAVGDDD